MVFLLPSYEKRIRRVCGRTQRFSLPAAWGGVYICIRNSQLSYKCSGAACPPRQQSVVNMVSKSHDMFGLPDCTFFVSIDDVPMCLTDQGRSELHMNNGITFNTHYTELSNIIAFPCFAFDVWPEVHTEYVEFYQQMMDLSTQPEWQWSARNPKLFWAGSITNHPFRKTFYDAWSPNTDLFDLRKVTWNEGVCSNFTALNEIVKFKRTLDIEGSGYSARLKYLFLSGSTVCYADRPYINEFYMGEFESGKDYITVPKSMTNVLNLFDADQEETMADIARSGFEKATSVLHPQNILYNISEGIKLIYQLTKKNIMIGQHYTL